LRASGIDPNRTSSDPNSISNCGASLAIWFHVAMTTSVLCGSDNRLSADPSGHPTGEQHGSHQGCRDQAEDGRPRE
jgi:hypothetical protein